MSRGSPATVDRQGDPHCPARPVAAPAEPPIGDLVLAFKALGDPVRLRLLLMIAAHPNGEACVCDLTPAFTVSGPTISHHLKTLREAGLVTCDRRGTWVFYRAVTDTLRRLGDVLRVGEDATADAP